MDGTGPTLTLRRHDAIRVVVHTESGERIESWLQVRRLERGQVRIKCQGPKSVRFVFFEPDAEDLGK